MSGHEADPVGFLYVHILFQGNVLGLRQLKRAGGGCLEWDFSKKVGNCYLRKLLYF